jgi:NADH-quinone oxidoreductase subunit F
MLAAAQVDVKMDFTSLLAAGSMLGSGAVIVMDDTACMVHAAAVLVRFFEHESCGKCTPCREGTYWMRHLIDRVRGNGVLSEDVALLLNVAKQMQNKCLCPLGEFATMAVVTGIERFPQDFAERVGAGN